MENLSIKIGETENLNREVKANSPQLIQAKLARYKPIAKQGDIILFRNTTDFISREIERITNSYFSHSAIILTTGTGETKAVAVLQSTAAITVRASKTIIPKVKVIDGVDIMPLEQEIQGDEDFCVLRPTRTYDDIGNAVRMVKLHLQWHNAYNFGFYFRVLVNKFFGWDNGKITAKHALVCSQLVQVYTDYMYMPQFDIPEIIPQTFYDKRGNDLGIIIDKG